MEQGSVNYGEALGVETRNISQNVDLICYQGREIYIVGTAHVSKDSADLVEKTINEYLPENVCVELCQARFASIKNPEAWRETDLFQIIKSGKSYVLMTQLALSSFQKKIADKFGIRPGEEVRRAIELSEAKGIKLELIDRDVKTTIKRAWRTAGFWSLTKLFFSLLFSSFSTKEIQEVDIEQLKSSGALTTLLQDFSEYLPGIKTALIDERDRYMAEKIRNVPGKKVIAIVGAGHVPGILKNFGKTFDLLDLEIIPPARLSSKIISFSIPALVIGMILWASFSSGDTHFSMHLVSYWILITGGLSAIGAAIALAHPLTIFTAFVAAPFTTLHPLLAAGWFAGLSEAYFRQPQVKDLESISEDVLSLRGIWRNGVSRVLLVVCLSNLGSALGAILGAGWIASWLS